MPNNRTPEHQAFLPGTPLKVIETGKTVIYRRNLNAFSVWTVSLETLQKHGGDLEKVTYSEMTTYSLKKVVPVHETQESALPEVEVEAVELPVFFQATFPRWNSRPNLGQYLGQLRNNHVDPYECRVTHLVILTDTQWVQFTENLLHAYPWLKRKGGFASFYEAPEPGIDFNELPPPEQTKWMEQSYRQVVVVTRKAGGETLLVDSQGFNYARFIGFVQPVEQQTQPVPQEEVSDVVA